MAEIKPEAELWLLALRRTENGQGSPSSKLILVAKCASFEGPVVIKKILDQLDQNIPTHQALDSPESRASPPTGLMVSGKRFTNKL